jgi:hypothetical protein
MRWILRAHEEQRHAGCKRGVLFRMFSVHERAVAISKVINPKSSNMEG